MKKVNETLKICRICNRTTIHHRNTKEMSWVAHLFLTIVSLGLWFFIWVPIAIWHGLTKPIGGEWSCSRCGSEGYND